VSNQRKNFSLPVQESEAIWQRASLGQQAFHRLISMERRRAERSKKSFLLMLAGAEQRPFDRRDARDLGEAVLTALMPMTRETDVIGWYKDGTVAGVMFTEIAVDDMHSTVTAIMNRVSKALKNRLTTKQFGNVNLSFHLLPEERKREVRPSHADLLPDRSLAAHSLAV